MKVLKNITLACLNSEQKSRTIGYWYSIQVDYSTNWTAFKTKQGLLRWLEERGLSLSSELPEKEGEHKFIPIIGEYAEESYSSYDAFYNLDKEDVVRVTRTLSNGSYTLGLITEEPNGMRCVNYLNSNCKHRPVFDYFESDNLMS